MCLFVYALTAEPFDLRPPLPVKGDCLCVCNQWAFVDNRAGAVDRILITDDYFSHKIRPLSEITDSTIWTKTQLRELFVQ